MPPESLTPVTVKPSLYPALRTMYELSVLYSKSIVDLPLKKYFNFGQHLWPRIHGPYSSSRWPVIADNGRMSWNTPTRGILDQWSWSKDSWTMVHTLKWDCLRSIVHNLCRFKLNLLITYADLISKWTDENHCKTSGHFNLRVFKVPLIIFVRFFQTR